MLQRFHSWGKRLLGTAVVLTLGGALLGCSAALDRLGEALYPTATQAAVAETPDTEGPILAETAAINATLEPTFTPEATPLPMPPTLAEPETTPQTGDAYQLVYARGGSLYRGDYVGADAVEAAIAPQLETWGFHNGLVASVQGRAIDLLDLTAGRLYSLQVNTTDTVDNAEILWGVNGTALLHIAWLADATAESERSVELRGLSVPDGTELGVVRMSDVTGLSVLRYDDALGRVAFIAYDADATFDQVYYYDLASGALVNSFPASGTGSASLSPDGRYLLAQQIDGDGSRLMLYDLNGEAAPLVWDQTLEHSVSHVWSPDSQYVAFLLRTGSVDDASTQSLGVWVLNVTTMQAQQVIEEPSLSASLSGWTPDGEYIVGYHRGSGEDVYLYLIRPDGSDRRILTLPTNAQVLGWMPAANVASVPQVVVDPWRARFVAAVGDTQATADLVAEIVATQSELDDQALLRQITDYLQQAGWQMDASPSLKRVAQSTFVVQLPPFAIYVIEPQSAQQVASGQVVLDARLVDDDLGLVFGVLGDGIAQPAFALLRRQADGTWQTLWTPQGQRDWIATDGEIAFSGEGLETLQVSGTSFGLDESETSPFSECRACPHRQFVANWVRNGDQYVRETQLAADAALDDVLWEMTQSTPYGVLYECIRRLRQDLAVDDLVANSSVVTKIREDGLASTDLRLAPSEELEDRVSFATLDGTRQFTALVQSGQIIYVEESQ